MIFIIWYISDVLISTKLKEGLFGKYFPGWFYKFLKSTVSLPTGWCGGRVRDCSVKPAARIGIVGGKSEDLQRKARAAGNAHVIKKE